MFTSVIQQDGDSRDCFVLFYSEAFLLYETMYVTKWTLKLDHKL